MSEIDRAGAGLQAPRHDAPTPSRSGVLAAVCTGLAVAVVLAVLGVSLGLATTHTVAYRVISGSMQPTLPVGDVVHVDTAAYASAPPSVGDIIAFHAPQGAVAENPICGAEHTSGEACPRSTPAESSQTFIKRVVAGPGDTIAVAGGVVVLNGALQLEPFAKGCDAVASCNLPVAIRVPAGDWFVMGDDRERSDDSRSWGPIPSSWIIGRVIG